MALACALNFGKADVLDTSNLDFDVSNLKDIKLVEPILGRMRCGMCHICGKIVDDEKLNSRQYYSRVHFPYPCLNYCDNNLCKLSANASMDIFCAERKMMMYDSSTIKNIRCKVRRSSGAIEEGFSIDSVVLTKLPDPVHLYVYGTVHKGVPLSDFLKLNSDIVRDMSANDFVPNFPEYFPQSVKDLMTKSIVDTYNSVMGNAATYDSVMNNAAADAPII